MALGDQRARRVVTCPVVREGLDEFFNVVVVGGESGDEVGEGGRLIPGVVGEGGGGRMSLAR